MASDGVAGGSGGEPRGPAGGRLQEATPSDSARRRCWWHPAVQQDLSLSAELVGTIDGYVNAEIRARVKGFLKTQDYADGAFVKKDQLLFTIDPAEYQAAAAKAKGALTRAQAALGQAKVTADRYRPLAAKQAVSQQDLDDAVAAQAAAAATVDSAKAALDEAQLNLGYCRITSPVDGVAGHAAGPGGESGRSG